MQRLVSIGFACIAGFALLACSSEADPLPTGDFYKGEQVNNGAAGAGSSAFDPPFKAAEYPAGPYGTNVGSTIANYNFRGWLKPVDAGYDDTKFEDVAMSDFFDPTGEKSIKIIMLNASAVWCTVCRAEYSKFKAEGTYLKYRAMGAEFVSAIFEDAKNPPNPAKPGDLSYWGVTYSGEFPMILDPGFKLGQFFTADATPMNLLIDAKTMKIVGKYLGGDTTAMFAQLEKFVAQN
ncbi:MAG TPA: redoxin domain-containing protein [Polyangiaceae bacterium]|nr:redoxin domain-containing protein [Polyangiaceae bacterium]